MSQTSRSLGKLAANALRKSSAVAADRTQQRLVARISSIVLCGFEELIQYLIWNSGARLNGSVRPRPPAVRPRGMGAAGRGAAAVYNVAGRLPGAAHRVFEPGADLGAAFDLIAQDINARRK